MDTQSAARHDAWASGENYEPYVGRWSRAIAPKFIDWLGVREGSHWLDVGCGTGALSQTILHKASPATVRGIDRSQGFVTYAQMRVQDARAQFGIAQSTFYDWQERGLMPPGIALGVRSVGWPAHELDALAAARIRGAREEEMREAINLVS